MASDLLGAPGPRLLLQELYLHQTQRLQTRETHLSSRDIQQGGKYSQGKNSKQKEIQWKRRFNEENYFKTGWYWK